MEQGCTCQWEEQAMLGDFIVYPILIQVDPSCPLHGEPSGMAVIIREGS